MSTINKWQDGEIDGVILRKAVKHTDQRGWLAEIFRSDGIQPDLSPVMAYISVTHPGVARGPHAHAAQTDMFAFFGPGTFRIRLWDAREKSPTFGNMQTRDVGQDEPTIVVVPPGVVHGYRNISDVDAWVLNLPNRLFAGEGRKEPVDEVRYEDLDDHQFSME